MFGVMLAVGVAVGVGVGVGVGIRVGVDWSNSEEKLLYNVWSRAGGRRSRRKLEHWKSIAPPLKNEKNKIKGLS